MWKAWILSVCAAGIASLVAPNDAVASDRTTPPAVETKTISLLGFDICFGDASAACDLRLPALSSPPAKRITLLGKTLCVGGAAQSPGCDVRLPAPEPSAAQKMDHHG